MNTEEDMLENDMTVKHYELKEYYHAFSSIRF